MEEKRKAARRRLESEVEVSKAESTQTERTHVGTQKQMRDVLS